MTFGRTSEKRFRSQPWLLDAKEFLNQPLEVGALEALEESEEGRKMMKLPFRRFFRQITTTIGGTTTGQPPLGVVQFKYQLPILSILPSYSLGITNTLLNLETHLLTKV